MSLQFHLKLRSLVTASPLRAVNIKQTAHSKTEVLAKVFETKHTLNRQQHPLLPLPPEWLVLRIASTETAILHHRGLQQW